MLLSNVMCLKIISNSRFALTGKIGIERKTRQIAGNKQTFDLPGKLKLREKLVKTLKVNKVLI